jgi:Na+/phosphate symporter
MIIVLWSVLIAVVGLLLYLMSPQTQPKAAEVGRIMFGVGLLVTLLRLGGAAIGLVTK